MARGSHHSSGGHHGSHHSSGGGRSHSYSRSSSHSSSHRSYRSRSGGYGSSSGISWSSPSVSKPPQGVQSYNGNWIHGTSFHLNSEDITVRKMAGDKKITISSGIEYFIMVFVVWILFLSIFSSNSFYEAVIPIFENMNMADLTFLFIDELVYYTPVMLVMVFTVIIVIIARDARNKQLALCKEVVEFYQKQELEQRVEMETQDRINHTQFYTQCPNCNAPAESGSFNCEYCGSSLVKEE